MNPNIKDSKNRYTGLQLATMNDRFEVVQYFLTFTTLARVASLTNFEKQKLEPASVSNLSNAASINTSSYCNFTAVKNLSELNSVNTHMRSKTNLSKALTSSNSSIISASTNKNSIYNPDSIANVNYRKFKKRFNFKSQLSVVGSEKSNEQENKSTTSIAKEPLVKKPREKISINSNMTYFEADNKFKKEPISVFKNFIIDLNSQSSDGQNVLHTAARFGKYDIAYLLLKKYGSNHLDINKLDFRGRTCLDLAWEWLLNSTNIEPNTVNSRPNSTGKFCIFCSKFTR
jgi:ankyrin repeat protein